MFRKTAAIAILILLVSSLFAGSVTIAPAKEQAGASKAGYSSISERLNPAAFKVMRGMMSEAYSSGEPGAGFAPVVVVNGAYVSNGPETVMSVDGVPGAGFAHSGMAGGAISDVPDTGMAVYGAHGAGYIMVLTNESSIEITGPPTAQFIFNNNMFGARLGSALTDMKSRMAGAGAANFIIHSPVLMFGSDGAAPETYDMKWESHHAFTGAPGEFGNFTGHLAIPWGNGSGPVFGPDGLLPVAGGTIELNGSMMVDMANLTFADDSTAKADVYNNEISGGQTNWHKVDISNAVKSFSVDLKWQNVNDSLRLVLYSPDGKILGPFYDDADGKTDARINLNIANPSGVASGEWHLKVTDMAALGNDDYYVKTY